MNATNLSFDMLNPYVRRSGLQGQASWKNVYRKIYDYEWMYCIHGAANYETPSESYCLTSGDLLLIRPNLPHKFWIDPNESSGFIWVHFDYNYRPDVCDLTNIVSLDQSIYFENELPNKSLLRDDYIFENRFTIPTIISVKNRCQMEDLFKDILEKYTHHTITWQLEAKSNLLLIIKLVIDQLLDKSHQSSYNSKLSKELYDYINLYYYRKITRRELAQYFSYNEDYIGKVFKESYHLSISQYTNQLRIDNAKKLLSDSSLSIDNISELLGFSDVSYFSNTMRKLTGYYPTVWRKMYSKI